jgi:hypothetical protein
MLKKIISGGQTGADWAGLEAAKALGIPTGGTAPKGYRTEHGPAPALGTVFGLIESHSTNYLHRTAENIRNSDATVIFGITTSPGSRQTIAIAASQNKPLIINPSAAELREFIINHEVKVLNVAGNRASVNPKVTALTYNTLIAALKENPDVPA